MSALGLIVPIVAAGSLTVALLVPLRDARRGERATLRGRTPIRPSFGTNEKAERVTNVSPVVRFHRALDAVGETFVTALRLRARPVPATASEGGVSDAGGDSTTDGSFESQLARIVGEPTGIDSLSPPEPHEDECDSSNDTSAADEPTEFEADESDERSSFPMSQAAERWRSGTLIARDLPPPLTRLRLRPDCGAITWPMHLPLPRLGTSETERRIILTDLANTAEPSHESALACAYREEDALGRAMVLRALSRISSDGAQTILVDALNLGSDDERALAVDLLSMGEDRESLISALHDRVDAIAARAALAYVRSNRRSDYEKLLSSRLDKRRLEIILALLGGILE